ncbi:MAG: hypothetical protein ACP5I8_12325 [Phycisphaerae bacterium]
MSNKTLTKQIINGLKQLTDPSKGIRSDPVWTDEVKKCIATIGEKNKWTVAGVLGSALQDPEWLYDLVWFKNDKKGFLRDVGLALESEWGTSADVKYDFEKLLQAKSRLKVMVCQAKDNQKVKELFASLKEGIQRFDNRGIDETYILAIYDNEKGEFVFEQVNGIIK